VDIDIADRVRISALDISAPALGIYRKSNPKAEQLIHASIFNIPAPDESFDGVYNLGVMEHFTEPEILQILKEFHRVLREGGKILLFWPPSFGLTVRVLAGVHWFANKVLSKPLKLHPDEITHVRSKRQVRAYLKDSGFLMVEFYFGFRDVFTQAVVVGYKPTRVDAVGARGTRELARANRH
jgi:ubiquinone/menaquinone biosynthesis C-methylase UbiE